VPRVRIELTTRRFSDPIKSTAASEKDADPPGGCPVNVRSFLAEGAREAAVAFASACAKGDAAEARATAETLIAKVRGSLVLSLASELEAWGRSR